MTAAVKKAAAPKPPAEEKVEKPSSFTVTVARIQVAVGSQVLQFSQGDVLPNGIAEDSIEHLSDRGFIAKV